MPRSRVSGRPRGAILPAKHKCWEDHMRRREFVGLVGGGIGSFAASPWLGTVAAVALQTVPPPAPGGPRPAQASAGFIASFDLKSAPPVVIDRARVAFVDTVGVMLAGSQHRPTDLICDIIKAEGSAPAATVV